MLNFYYSRLLNRRWAFFFGLILTAAVAAQDYVPLSWIERRTFVKNVKALEIAAADGNYVGVRRFGPGILKKYESVLLDPSCKKLRPMYELVERLIEDMMEVEAADTFDIQIQKLVDGGDYLAALQVYDDYFDYLAEKGGDSVIAVLDSTYRGVMLKFFDGSFEALKKFDVLRHADTVLLDSLRRGVEKSYQELFNRLASSNNIEELFDFRMKYPGLYAGDIENLVNDYRLKWRLSIKRYPSLDKIEQFYMVFPEKDKMVDSVHEKLLYDAFKKEKDLAAAMKYLSHFPNGRNSRELRTFAELQQEQQRMAQLEALQKLQSSPTPAGDYGN